MMNCRCRRKRSSGIIRHESNKIFYYGVDNMCRLPYNKYTQCVLCVSELMDNINLVTDVVSLAIDRQT